MSLVKIIDLEQLNRSDLVSAVSLNSWKAFDVATPKAFKEMKESWQ